MLQQITNTLVNSYGINVNSVELQKAILTAVNSPANVNIEFSAVISRISDYPIGSIRKLRIGSKGEVLGLSEYDDDKTDLLTIEAHLGQGSVRYIKEEPNGDVSELTEAQVLEQYIKDDVSLRCWFTFQMYT